MNISDFHKKKLKKKNWTFQIFKKTEKSEKIRFSEKNLKNWEKNLKISDFQNKILKK